MPTARARAIVAACALLVAPALAPAAELGTLFHTPEERERLDRMRRGEADVPVVARLAHHAITGFIRRSDGRNTVWIDGRAVAVSSAQAAALIEHSEGEAAERPRIKLQRKK